jgi:hypothetical protein
MKPFAFGLFAICLGLVCAPTTFGDAHIEFIDMGTPKNGAVTMNGWRGVVVRVSLDGGLPITRLQIAQEFPDDGDIYGNIAQRWTDPTGQGNYSVNSPGPMTANNSFSSDFNFDSHLLGDASSYTVQKAVETSRRGFLTSRTGLPSDGFVGYGAAPFTPYYLDPILFSQGGHFGGVLDVNPAFQSSSMDVAYVVTDSAFLADIGVMSGNQLFSAGGTFEVPEPGSWWMTAGATMAALLRRRKRRKVRENHNSLEMLEPRVQLTVAAPTGVTVASTADETGTQLVVSLPEFTSRVRRPSYCPHSCRARAPGAATHAITPRGGAYCPATWRCPPRAAGGRRGSLAGRGSRPGTRGRAGARFRRLRPPRSCPGSNPGK